MSGFTQMESEDSAVFKMRCNDCNQQIKRRSDSFVPGLHATICLACGQTSSAIDLLDGNKVMVTAESHRS